MGFIGREAVVLTPLTQPDQDSKEVAAFLGQDVPLIGRSVRGWTGLENAKRRELSQARRQDASRDAKSLLKFIEARYAIERVAHDEQRPPVTNRIERARDRTIRAP